MPEETLRLASLAVLGGPLHGRRFDLEEAVAEVLIGSDPDCHFHVDAPGISPIHARIWAQLSNVTVHDTHAPGGVYVNMDRVEGEAPVTEGDVIWLGAPREPGSVCVQCRFEPWVEVLPPVAAAPEGDGEAAVEPSSALAALPDAAAAPTAAVVEPPVATAPSAPDSYEAVILEEEGIVVEEAAAAPTPEPPLAILPPAASEERAKAPPSETPTAPLAAPPEPEREFDPFFFGEPAAEVAPPAASEPEDAFFIGAEAESGAGVPTVSAATPTPAAVPLAALPSPADVLEDEFFIADAGPSAGGAAAEGSVVIEADLFAAPEVRPPAPQPSPPVAGPAAATPPALAATPGVPAPPAVPQPPGPAPARVPAVETAASPAVSPTPERAARPTEPRPRPRPAPTARPSVGPAGRRPTAGPARRAERPARGGARPWLRSAALGLAAVAGLAAVGVLVWMWLGARVRLESMEPARARVGQKATLRGRGFGNDPGAVTVRFGDKAATVLQAAGTTLDVEVPEAVAEPGAERRVPVVVRVGRGESAPVEVSVFQAPRLHGLSPDVALPGEEVLLAGAGWGAEATVRFGSAPAQVVEVQAARIRAIVPEIVGGPGTSAPVVVEAAGIDSNEIPFLLGRPPLVVSVTPASAVPGDVIALAGRGFDRQPLQNDVRIAGARALVTAVSDAEIKVVVPRVPPAEPVRAIEVRVPASTNVGQATVAVPTTETIDFRFVAEPFDAVAGRPHAVLASGLGPAFVLAASGGRTAAERALEAQQRWNGAAQILRSTRGLTVEARGYEANPVIALAGRPEALMEVTAEDASAYDEDWTGLRGRGGAVTRARLARWWEAVGRDLVSLLVRGERPAACSSLAPEGRVLGQLFDVVQRAGGPGVPQAVMTAARPPIRDGLRLLGLRVPAGVAEPSFAAPVAAGPAPMAATPAPPVGRLRLEGTWTGREVEESLPRYLTVTFRSGGGTISYEGGITLTMPLASLAQPARDRVRFSVQIRGGARHYLGSWDGEMIKGTVSRDAAGESVVGSFELRPR